MLYVQCGKLSIEGRRGIVHPQNYPALVVSQVLDISINLRSVSGHHYLFEVGTLNIKLSL